MAHAGRSRPLRRARAFGPTPPSTPCRRAPHRRGRPAATVPVEQLRKLCTSSLLGFGYAPDEAEVLADVVMYAQLRGNSQGISKLTRGTMAPPADRGPLEVTKQSPTSALVNGNNDQGMLVLHHAAELCVRKAQLQGIAVVGTYGTSTGTGCLGYFAHKVACQGLLGVLLSQSPEMVAPAGSHTAVFGTNPLCMSIPRGPPSCPRPLTVDLSTSACTWADVVAAAADGQHLPPGAARTAAGADTTDANEVLSGGVLVPFGGHKGSAIAFLVEVLAGALVGAAVEDKGRAGNWGNLVLAIDPAVMQGASQFQESIEALLRRVRAAEPLPGGGRVRVPGERSEAAAERASTAGLLEVDDRLLAELETCSRRGSRSS